MTIRLSNSFLLGVAASSQALLPYNTDFYASIAPQHMTFIDDQKKISRDFLTSYFAVVSEQEPENIRQLSFDFIVPPGK